MDIEKKLYPSNTSTSPWHINMFACSYVTTKNFGEVSDHKDILRNYRFITLYMWMNHGIQSNYSFWMSWFWWQYPRQILCIARAFISPSDTIHPYFNVVMHFIYCHGDAVSLNKSNSITFLNCQHLPKFTLALLSLLSFYQLHYEGSGSRRI